MKNKKNKKNHFFSFFLSFLGCIVLAVLACFLALKVSLSPVDSQTNAKTVRVEIPSGSSASKIAEILVEKGLIRSDRAFYLAVRFPFISFRKTVPTLQAGFYSLSSSMDCLQIIKILENGEQDIVKVSIPEGLTISKIAGILEKNEICAAEDFISSCYNPLLLEKYMIPSHSFEGFLFPDTYYFAPEMGAEKALAVMVETFFEKISTIPYYADKNPEKFYEDLVLASIVEREYRNKDEAPLIASVFKNRIKSGVGLYSCATIEYIITEIQGKSHPDVITYDDLKIDSPYNTYKWAALPPTPISNPGFVALKAVADSPETEYFYFTLTDAAAGTHTFSKSFNAHVKAGTQFKTKK